MDKRLRALIFVLSSLALLSACNKEEKVEVPKEFPVLLRAERLEVRAETRLFANNQEIKDKSIIQQFEEKEDLAELFEAAYESNIAQNTLRFDSESQAHFYDGDDTGKKFSLQRKGTRFLFYSLDAITMNPLLPPTNSSLGYYYVMLDYMDTWSGTGNDGLRSSRTVRVAHGNFKVLKVSAFAYAMNLHSLSDNGSIPVKSRGYFFNEFNPEVVKYLKTNDTLAVKEYSLIYTLGN
jgi:hypothetical protein